jgi:DNA-binding transcriptional ArsR family regulator
MRGSIGEAAVQRYVVGPADAGRLRFGCSALWETVLAVRTLVDPVQRPYHLRWLAGVDVGRTRAELPCLDALTPTRGWTPGFLTPPPGPRGQPDRDAELAQVRATPAALVSKEIRRTAESQQRPTPLLAELADHPEPARDRIAAELELAWDRLIAPVWPQVRRLLEDDMAFRSSQVVEHGLEPTVNGLDERIRWRGDRITVRTAASGTTELAGRGLLLMPTAFGWPRVIALEDEGWPPAVAYPARGIGALWSAAAPVPDALGRLLGPNRAAVLAALDQEATTTALAGRLALTPAAVSRHLTLMQQAGLVLGRRQGREVRYRRTPAGTTLLRAAEPRQRASSRAWPVISS